MISQKRDITLILPAYDEAKTICTTIAEAAEYFRRRRLSYEIIVSADGDDGTREIALEFAKQDDSVRVIGGRGRRGKGRGIRDGVKLAAGAVVGFADADNKVPISEFDKIETWLNKGIEVVIGSRAMDRSQIERRQPWYRRIGSQGFGYILRAVVGVSAIRDTQCGFKFFPREIAQDLFSRQQVDGYMFDVEILALAQRLGYRIVEVPIRWRDDADSRLQLFSGNIRNLADLFRIRMSCERQSQIASAAFKVKSGKADAY